MTMTDLRTYSHENADATNVLGRLVIYTVSDLCCDHSRLKDILNRHGLAEYCPSPPADSDVFRRVSKTVQRNREDLGDGTYLNVLVRDVTTGNTNEIVRRVVVEHVDPKGKRLDYTEAWDILFDKEHAVMSTRRIPGAPVTEADPLIADLHEEFRAKRNTVDGNAVRSLLQRIFDGKHAVSVRPAGGVAFLPKPHMAATDAIKAVGDEFPEVTVMVVPLLDSGESQDDVTRYVGAATSRDVDELMGKCREIISSGDASTRKLNGMATDFRAVKARLETYQDLLDNDLSALVSQTEMLDQMMASALLAASSEDAA